MAWTGCQQRASDRERIEKKTIITKKQLDLISLFCNSSIINIIERERKNQCSVFYLIVFGKNWQNEMIYKLTYLIKTQF